MKRNLILLFTILTSTIFFMSGCCANKCQRVKKECPSSKSAAEVKEISYDQLLERKTSGKNFILADVLLAESYNKGHIPGAISFPYNTITKENANKLLAKDSEIVVYCGSFKCQASTKAAQALSALGYNVVDYKGGLKEWQEKGNKLVT